MFKIVSLVKIVLSLMIVLSVSSFAKSYPTAPDIKTLEVLNNKELNEIFKGGNTIVGINLKFKAECIQNYYDDNTYNGSVANGKKKIAGTWKIENDMICHFPKNKNIKKCRAVYKDADYFVELNKKNMKSILRFKLK